MTGPYEERSLYVVDTVIDTGGRPYDEPGYVIETVTLSDGSSFTQRYPYVTVEPVPAPDRTSGVRYWIRSGVKP